MLIEKFELLKSSNITMPLTDLAKLCPQISSAMDKFLTNFDSDSNIVANLKPSISNKLDCVYIKCIVNHQRVIAIVDTGAPDIIVSSKLMRSMKLAPDI
jgi:hypothetical protein